jgi:hypothetical protein
VDRIIQLSSSHSVSRSGTTSLSADINLQRNMKKIADPERWANRMLGRRVRGLGTSGKGAKMMA